MRLGPALLMMLPELFCSLFADADAMVGLELQC